ncbi:MAG: hypothetical protein EBR86_13130 [Planctomycetia bacterium]|nr:hypothetical protein [Planctomycetia bacterium]
MQSFLARCCLLAVLAAGFVCTGDAARLLRTAARLMNSTHVPGLAPAPGAHGAAPEPAVAPVTSAAASRLPAAGVALPLPLDPSTPATTGPDAPVSRPIGPPPADGPVSIRLADLAPGTRVLVWIGHGSRRDPLRTVEVIALDVIDPVTGEALEYRHAGTGSDDGSPLPPRRVRLPEGTISRGGNLARLPVHGVHRQPEGWSPERIGPVLAVSLARGR